MPLNTPPQVRLGPAGAWLSTQWDPTYPAALVGAGPRSMTVRDIAYLRWTVRVDDGPPQVYRLLVAGSAATSPPAGTPVLAAGTHQTFSRVVDTPESVERQTGSILVGA